MSNSLPTDDFGQDKFGSNEVSKELRDLAHKSFDGPLVEDEVRHLESLLDGDKAAQRWYARAVMLHADLADHKKAMETCKHVLEQFPRDILKPDERLHERARLTPPQCGSARRATSRRSRNLFHSPMAASVLAVALFAGCGMGLFMSSMMHVDPVFIPTKWDWAVGNEVVAKMVSTHQVSWQSSLVPESMPTKGVRPGQQIRLDSGRMQLVFRNGASVILQGPAVFTVQSNAGGKLYSGKLTVTVPKDVAAFFIATLTGEMSCGPGHFGIEVSDQSGIDSSDASTKYYAFVGAARGKTVASFLDNTGERHGMKQGDAISAILDGHVASIEIADKDEYLPRLPKPVNEPFLGDAIHLGNLFDDSKGASLTEAMLTDQFQAAGETIDLGIAAVVDGGLDVDIPLAENGVRFCLANVGCGGPRVLGLPGNDTYRSTSPVPIRTTGEEFEKAEYSEKIEEGIGMCTNELITFDLDELRRAGALEGRDMRFVCDRAGINDREPPALEDGRQASARFIVIVSTEEDVLSGFVNGQPYKTVRHGNVFSFDLLDQKQPRILRRNGEFVSFDVPVPPHAKFLTLATGMIFDPHDDHSVFSGARLELGPDPSKVASIKDNLMPSTLLMSSQSAR